MADQLRVWYQPTRADTYFTMPVRDSKEAIFVLEILIEYDDWWGEEEARCGLEAWGWGDEDGWTEWQDRNGKDISDLMMEGLAKWQN